MVVADAGPLIALGRIGRLRLARETLGMVVVPEAVTRECLQDPLRPDALAIERAFRDRVLIQRAAEVSTEPLLRTLGEGEAAAIALASMLRAPVLLDERKGRGVAIKLGLSVIGTGGVLIRAKRAGLVPAVAPILAELRQSGYRLSDAVVEEILVRASEAK